MNELKLVLLAAVKVLLVRKTQLIIGLILPVIIYLATQETSQWLVSYTYEQLIKQSDESILDAFFRFKLLLIFLIQSVFVSLAGIFITINIHRVLLGRYVSKKLSLLSVYIKFCWVTLLLFPVYLIVFIPFWNAYSSYKYDPTGFNLMIISGAIIWALGGMSLISRVALVFPAIAIGHPISIKKSIELTRPHMLLMVVIIAVLPLLFLGINIALSYVQMPEIIRWPFSYMKSVMYFLIEVSCLSTAYLHIIKRRNLSMNK